MSEKTKDQLLEELVEVGFITSDEKETFDGLSKAGLESLIEKVFEKELSDNSSVIKEQEEEIERLKTSLKEEADAFNLTIENQKLEIERLEKSSDSGKSENPLLEKRLENQRSKDFLKNIESLTLQLSKAVNEFKTGKK